MKILRVLLALLAAALVVLVMVFLLGRRGPKEAAPGPGAAKAAEARTLWQRLTGSLGQAPPQQSQPIVRQDPTKRAVPADLGPRLAALVGPGSKPIVKPDIDNDEITVTNPLVGGVGAVSITAVKGKESSWAISIPAEGSPLKPADFAQDGAITRLCKLDGEDRGIYEIDRGPLQGSFLRDRGDGYYLLASLDFIATRGGAMDECLRSTGRIPDGNP